MCLLGDGQHMFHLLGQGGGHRQLAGQHGLGVARGGVRIALAGQAGHLAVGAAAACLQQMVLACDKAVVLGAAARVGADFALQPAREQGIRLQLGRYSGCV